MTDPTLTDSQVVEAAVRATGLPAERLRLNMRSPLDAQSRLTILHNACVTKAEAGTVDNWRINDLAKNVQLRRYVARLLAWPNDKIEAMLADLAGIIFFPEGDHGY